MSKNGEYVIRVLPEPDKSIQRDFEKKGFCWKIKGYTFPNIPLKFSIRPRAVYFSKRKFLTGKASQTYVVLYFSEEKMKCLYTFRFHKNRYGQTLSMCRCIGKNVSRHHWTDVTRLIYDNKDEILALKEMELKKFSVV